MKQLIIDVYENRDQVVKLGMVSSGYAMPFQQYLETKHARRTANDVIDGTCQKSSK